MLVLALVPRLRREFKKPNFYFLLAAFAICLVPPIVWNHAACLGHAGPPPFARESGRRARFSSARVARVSRRAFLLFFPAPLSRNCLGGYRELVARPPALQGPLSDLVRSSRFSVLFPALDQQAGCAKLGRAGFCQSRACSPAPIGRSAWPPAASGEAIFCAGVLLALLMSMIALDTDLLRSAGVRISRRDPADAVRGWKSAARAVEKIRSELEPKLGEPLFVIADQRDRASEMAFYFQRETGRRSRASTCLHCRIAGHHEPVFFLAAL